MASISERLSENATGRFYVTANCIACGLCYSEAPAFFRLREETGFALVYRQPITAAEIALAEEAVQSCPVEAIGGDGDSPTTRHVGISVIDRPQNSSPNGPAFEITS